MKYFGEKNYEHGSKNKTGVLITNLGAPDAPNAKSLKIYLIHSLVLLYQAKDFFHQNYLV